MKDFDNSVKGGKQLNKDLRELRGLDHILMEVRFPNDYPNKPFSCVGINFRGRFASSLRVATPRGSTRDREDATQTDETRPRSSIFRTGPSCSGASRRGSSGTRAT